MDTPTAKGKVFAEQCKKLTRQAREIKGRNSKDVCPGADDGKAAELETFVYTPLSNVLSLPQITDQYDLNRLSKENDDVKMPRYLGINYWQQVIDQRREFYSRVLLPVPHHLKQADPHGIDDHKLVDDSLWRTCRHAGPFTDVITTTIENLDFLKEFSEGRDFCGNKNSGPEKYDCNTEFHEINNEMVEVVPSSNPESVYSFVSDELLDSCDLFDNICEMFPKEDLTKYVNEEAKDILEDIVTSDGLKEIRTYIPQLPVLLSRLKPKSVKDPLVDDNGAVYTEDMCFKDKHLKMDTADTDNGEVTGMTVPFLLKFETFEKTSQLSVKSGELEEILSPPRKHDNSDDVIRMLDIDSDVKTCILNETEEEIVNEGSLKLISDATATEGLEKPDLTLSSPVQCVEFIKINSLELDDDKFENRALLESPLVKAKPQVLSPGPSLPDMLQELQPVSPDYQNTTNIFLRQFEKETLQTQICQEEKFFDEIIALRLPEPDLSRNISHRPDTVGDLIQQMQVGKESGLGKVELQLGWDPWLHSRALMSRAARVEHMSCDDVELETVLKEVETFVKFRQDQISNDMNLKQEDILFMDKGLPAKENTILEESQTMFQMEKKLPSSNHSEENATSHRKQTASTYDSLSDFSPFDQFMMMRMSENHQQKIDKPYTKQSKTVISNTVDEQKNIGDRSEVIACNSVHNVEFTGQYEQVLSSLYAFGTPYVDVLKQSGEVPKHASFSSLTLDTARFLVKQKEKQLEDCSKQESKNDLYKSLLVVYAVVGAADLLIHCCLESAISHLSAAHEKYQNTLGGSLDGIRKELFQFKVQFDHRNITHPKVATLCRYVEDCVKHSAAVSDKKVLVVVKRRLPSLMSYLEKSLSLCGNISTFTVKTLDKDTDSQIEKHNCIIIDDASIGGRFKWSLFHLVIEFESDTDTFSRRCQNENIDFVCLRTCYSHQEKVKKEEQGLLKLRKSPDVKVTVIGSQNFTSQKNLLQLLETRYNVAVIERNYYDIYDKYQFADIIIDERNCVVLHNVSDISEEWQVEHLSRKLAALGLQYTQCWLIFYSGTNSGGYLLPTPIVASISKIEAALANLNSNNDRFQIFYKVLIAYSLEQLAELVRSYCDTCVETSVVWKRDQWDRNWITGDPSKDEKFLLSLPCFNSFSAQLLLSQTCLGTLLSLTASELMRAAPYLPEKVLLTFYKIVNCDTGLHLRSQDKSEQEFHPVQKHLDHDTNVQVDYKHEHVSKNQNLQRPFVAQRTDYVIVERIHDLPATADSHNDKIENKTSFSQDTSDSSLDDSQDSKPNEYVLAEIDGMADMEGRLEDSVVPDFDLVCNSDFVPVNNSEKGDTYSGQRQFGFDDSNRFSEFSLYKNKNLLPRKEISNHNAPYSKAFLVETHRFSEKKMKLNKKPTFSSALHDKLLARNRIMEDFKKRDLYQNIHQDQCPQRGHLPFETNFQNSRYFPGNSGRPCYDDRDRGDRPVSSPGNDLHSYNPAEISVLGRSAVNSWSSLPRSASRKPVFSEQFQSRLLMPPVQRVSIGLAQPLRRNLPGQKAPKGSSGCIADSNTRWLSEDSPPMDLEPDSPYNEPSLSHTPKENRQYSSSEQIQKGYKGCSAYGMTQEMQFQGQQFIDYEDYEVFQNKRKKLTYTPLPGRRAGQTVLSFR